MATNLKKFAAYIIALAQAAALMIFAMPVQAYAEYENSFRIALSDYDLTDDPDGCLTASEENSLLQIMQNTANKIGCNIGVVITSDLKGMSDSQYADWYGNTCFGKESSYVVMLLLNTHDNPAYSGYQDMLSLNGKGHDFYNNKANSIWNKVYAGLDSKGFYAAIKNFCSALESYAGSSGNYNDNRPSIRIDFPTLFVALAIGAVSAIIIVTALARGYSKKKALSATTYLNKDYTRVTRQVDLFLREYTTSYRSSSSSGGGHGGHSSHGGSHRSGGHSSHGGRHR